MNPASTSQKTSHELKSSTILGWLADAPLLINANLLASFYDAIVKPENKQGETLLEVNEESTSRVKGNVSLEGAGEFKPGTLLESIANYFPAIKISAKVTGSGEGESTDKDSKKSIVKLFPIETPQRQLVHLCISYLVKNPDKILLVSDPSKGGWRDANEILSVPRQIICLDFPSQSQAQKAGIPSLKLIPTAAEFANGKVVPLYGEFKALDGSAQPSYPEMGKKNATGETMDSIEKLYSARREYWAWFDTNYSAKTSMEIVEAAAEKNGKIHWIDYRLPLSSDGSTLHLHVSSTEGYTTGDLAYNLIKRGMEQGLRIVGTLKSGPAINVLAVFEK